MRTNSESVANINSSNEESEDLSPSKRDPGKLVLSLVHRKKRTTNIASTVLRHKMHRSRGSEAIRKTFKLQKVQNQLADTSTMILAGATHYEDALLYDVRFSSQRRKYHLCCCGAKRADICSARQACFMTRDCNITQQLVS